MAQKIVTHPGRIGYLPNVSAIRLTIQQIGFDFRASI
jgi:hypothetical protein